MNFKNKVVNQCFDEERALYNVKNTEIIDCRFAGPKDGESVLKESRNVSVKNCTFSLRYPLWHAKKFYLSDITMDTLTRAPIWYSKNGVIENTKIDGIKCLRECTDVFLRDCQIESDEFGWNCKNLTISETSIESSYLLFGSRNVEIKNLDMGGKYSFQYMHNLHISDSNLDTKDAFWHSKNVLVENSIVKGEYLGWFSENITFVNCRIIGTQPLCYCKKLKLVNCTMENADLAFEYSDVEATIKGHVESIKNPKSGIIKVESVGEVIQEAAVVKCNGRVKITRK